MQRTEKHILCTRWSSFYADKNLLNTSKGNSSYQPWFTTVNFSGQTDALAESQPRVNESPSPPSLESPVILCGSKWGQVCSNNLSKHGALRHCLPHWAGQGSLTSPKERKITKRHSPLPQAFFPLMYWLFILNSFFFFSWLKITGCRPSTWNQLHTLRDLFIKTLENVLKTCSGNFAIPYTCATAQLGAPPAEVLVPTFNSVFPDPSIGESERELKGQELLLKTPSQVLFTETKSKLSGKSIFLTLKARKIKPRCKHLQTEFIFFSYLCTWKEHWKGKPILILSWQCLSLLPETEIIISLVVRQLLREAIHWIFLCNHSTGFYFCCYPDGKCTQLVLCLAPFKLLQTWMCQASKHPNCTEKTKSGLTKLQATCFLAAHLITGRKNSSFKFLFQLRQWRLKSPKLLPLLSRT